MIGNQFKFIIDNGKQYVTSLNYPVVMDSSSNYNNVFDPKRLKWSNPKKAKSILPHAVIDINQPTFMPNEKIKYA